MLDQEENPPASGPLEIRFVTVDGGLPPDLDVSDRAAMHEWLGES